MSTPPEKRYALPPTSFWLRPSFSSRAPSALVREHRHPGFEHFFFVSPVAFYSQSQDADSHGPSLPAAVRLGRCHVRADQAVGPPLLCDRQWEKTLSEGVFPPLRMRDVLALSSCISPHAQARDSMLQASVFWSLDLPGWPGTFPLPPAFYYLPLHGPALTGKRKARERRSLFLARLRTLG